MRYFKTCRPVQVDIDIYKDKLSQSGNRILSSHVTNLIIYSPACCTVSLKLYIARFTIVGMVRH